MTANLPDILLTLVLFGLACGVAGWAVGGRV